MYNSNYINIDVLVNGTPCRQYSHQGKVFIEAKDKSEYQLKINNQTYNRLLVVSSVDGLNVLTGDPASEHDGGYIVNGRSNIKINGFRYSDTHEAAFKFTQKKASYAKEKTGNTENVGVIGFRLFNEYIPQIFYQTNVPSVWPPLTSTIGTGTSAGYQTANLLAKSITQTGAGGVMATLSSYSANTSNTIPRGISSDNITYDCCTKSCDFDTGTTWGQAINSNVTKTDFTRNVLVFSLEIYYASRESLIEIGVPVRNESTYSLPSAFPNKFATPPSGWKP